MARSMLPSNKHYNTDMVILRKVSKELLIEDRLSLDLAEPCKRKNYIKIKQQFLCLLEPLLYFFNGLVIDTNQSGQSNYQWIRGDRDSEGKWDVYFLRAVSTSTIKLQLILCFIIIVDHISRRHCRERFQLKSWGIIHSLLRDGRH